MTDKSRLYLGCMRELVTGIYKIGIGKKQHHKLQGSRRQVYRQILSACLCFAIFAAGSLPAQARVETVELEELAIPTEYPAKGVLHVQIASDKAADSAGNTKYIYQEGYLPVLTDESQMVYAQLQTLADFLGLGLSISEESAAVFCFNTTIYLDLGRAIAGYTNEFCNAYVNMGLAPISYEEVWYVPMDPFLKLVDAGAYYAGLNWLGREELYLIPPRRTALDDIGDFYKYVWNDYVFEYIRDTGMTIDQMKEVAGWATIGLCAEGLGKLNPNAWKTVLLGWWGDNSKAMQHEQIDEFMSLMLSAEENIISKTIETASGFMDGASVVMDLAEKAGGTERVRNVFQSIGGSDFSSSLTKGMRYLKAGQAVGMGAGHLLSLASVCDNLLRVDQNDLKAAMEFYEKSEGAASGLMTADYRKRLKRNLDDREKALAKVPEKWILEDWMKLAVNVGGLADISVLGSIGFFSSVWSVVTLPFGKQLDEMGAFHQGVFGMMYEKEAVSIARSDIEEMLTTGSGVRLQEADKEKLRRTVSHALKACYVTRYVGCQARSTVLEKHPQRKEAQERINDTIAGMIARLNMDDDVVPFGKLMEDLVDIHVQEYDHFPNVIFNVCQISGQVLSWEKEEPLKGVKIEVVGDDGKTLHEFQTDANGEFDEAFELNDVDPYADTPVQRELTLYLTYRRNPVILEYIQVQCFHSYLIQGLHAGKRVEEVIAYVRGVREEEGRTVLDIYKIELTDDTINFGVPDWHDGYIDTYAAMPDQIWVDADAESVVLDDDVSIQTIYAQMAPKGSLMGGLAELVGQMEGGLTEDLFQTEIQTAEEIRRYIDRYTEINGEVPAFRIRKVNSLVDSMEQVVVLTAD